MFAGKQTAQQGADNIAAAWDKLTDKLGRETKSNTIASRWASD